MQTEATKQTAPLYHSDIKMHQRRIYTHYDIISLHHFSSLKSHHTPAPEAAVHKNDRPILPEYKIRMSGKPWIIQPIPEPTTDQKLPYQQFRFRIPPFYRRHTTVSLFFCKFIHTHCFFKNKQVKQNTYWFCFQRNAALVSLYLCLGWNGESGYLASITPALIAGFK